MLRITVTLGFLGLFLCLTLEAQQSLYYINTSTGIESATFDGANRQVIIPADLVKAIQRANLNGAEVEDLVVYKQVNLDGIVLDIAKNKMYWTDLALRKIQRAKLDGSAIEAIIINDLDTQQGLS